MAVQAQYPSNVLLLNSRNGQEGNEFSLPPQSGGLLDQSQMLHSNGASVHSRKREREMTVAASGVIQTVPNNVVNGINSFCNLQSQTSQLMELSQLHNQQRNVVSTGLCLSFGIQQQQQQQHRLQLQQQQNMSHSSAFLSTLSEGFSSQIKQQRDEIDQFLQDEAEQLRRKLAEKRQRHYRALITTAEESFTQRLKERESEMEKATRRNAELEARAAQLSEEAQVWQAKAKAQEATAASLQAQLQHAIMIGVGMIGAQDKRDNGVGIDGVSCAVGGVEGQADDAESAYVDPERVTVPGPKCRGCEKRLASVVVLPCRHLCICTDCDMHFRACPVCLTVKNSTVEVYLS